MKFSSALVLSLVSAAALAESITTVIVATKDGHVYTKTVTQDATYVWGGEDSYASSSATDASVTESTSAAPETSTAAPETSTVAPEASVTDSVATSSTSADEGSGSTITTVIVATKDGHVYTKTVTQDATYVWTGEGSYSGSATWSTASSSAESTEAPSTTVESSSSATTSSSATLSSYTGAAGAVTVGSGLMGAAVAAAFLL